MTYITNKDFNTQVSMGLVKGHSVYIARGINPPIDTNESSDLWDIGGELNIQSSAITLYVSSTDAGDSSLLVIFGLDTNYDEQTYFVTVNGQNQVAIPGTWLRFFTATNISAADGWPDRNANKTRF